jgi:hypothetical protein
LQIAVCSCRLNSSTHACTCKHVNYIYICICTCCICAYVHAAVQRVCCMLHAACCMLVLLYDLYACCCITSNFRQTATKQSQMSNSNAQPQLRLYTARGQSRAATPQLQLPRATGRFLCLATITIQQQVPGSAGVGVPWELAASYFCLSSCP